MNNKIMQVVFAGHGIPMVALDNNEITECMTETGHRIIEKFGKPKVILAISAHWYTHGTFILDVLIDFKTVCSFIS